MISIYFCSEQRDWFGIRAGHFMRDGVVFKRPLTLIIREPASFLLSPWKTRIFKSVVLATTCTQSVLFSLWIELRDDTIFAND